MVYKLYQCLIWLTTPLVDLYLLSRKRRGKEDEARFSERLGYASRPRPAGKLLWVHAASVGESLSVVPLIEKLLEENSTLHVVLTTGTVSSAKMMQTCLPKRAFHQYIPLDRTSVVHRFLSHWKPDLAVWVESELWPILITETARQCPMVLLNGRMSLNSFRKWQGWQPAARNILGCFSLILGQTDEYAQRFSRLGAPRVTCVGNIKYDTPPLPVDKDKMLDLAAQINHRPFWVASSTHHDEERQVGTAHQFLKALIPEVLTIIAPRHPARAEEITAQLTAMGMKVARRSKGEKITPDTDVYLADTMGELGILYRLASIVFIGGSLISHGGQNPLEPARLDCAIIWGPNMQNFDIIAKEMLEKEAALQVNDKEQLAQVLRRLFEQAHEKEAYASAARHYVETKMGVITRVIAALEPYLQKTNKIL